MSSQAFQGLAQCVFVATLVALSTIRWKFASFKKQLKGSPSYAISTNVDPAYTIFHHLTSKCGNLYIGTMSREAKFHELSNEHSTLTVIVDSSVYRVGRIDTI